MTGTSEPHIECDWQPAREPLRDAWHLSDDYFQNQLRERCGAPVDLTRQEKDGDQTERPDVSPRRHGLVAAGLLRRHEGWCPHDGTGLSHRGRSVRSNWL